MPNMRKKMRITIYRFIIDGSEFTREFIARRNPSLFEMIFNGRRIRMIRIALKADKFTEPEFVKDSRSIEDMHTITKSKANRQKWSAGKQQ